MYGGVFVSKYLVLLSVLVAVMIPGRAQDGICEGLRTLHTVHGVSLTKYLNAEGLECLELAPTATPVPLNEEIWSASGTGEARKTISLELTRGVYQLNAPVPPSDVPDGHGYITDIISNPASCFLWETVSFPATVRIERDCKILATAAVYMSYIDRKERWSLSITKVSNDIPPIPMAEEWSASGRGSRHLPAALVFEPGTYSVNQHSGPPDARLTMLSRTPRECVPLVLRLPTHVSVKRRCTVEAKLWVWQDRSRWSFDITKLD